MKFNMEEKTNTVPLIITDEKMGASTLYHPLSFLTFSSFTTKEMTCLFLLPLTLITPLLFNSAKTVPIIPLYKVNLDSVEVSNLSLSFTI